jgi:hypothetical protein
MHINLFCSFILDKALFLIPSIQILYFPNISLPNNALSLYSDPTAAQSYSIQTNLSLLALKSQQWDPHIQDLTTTKGTATAEANTTTGHLAAFDQISTLGTGPPTGYRTTRDHIARTSHGSDMAPIHT